jgi:hypothetical protein
LPKGGEVGKRQNRAFLLAFTGCVSPWLGDQATKRIWLALGGESGSGLPVEIDNGPIDVSFLLSQYGSAIIDQVNFNKGRVRPNDSLDVAAGAEMYHKEQRSATFEIQTENLTDHVNVINFASLFSGTAVGSSRSVSAQLKLSF